ncbi:MAG: caspase family protein [Alphaproteobacteria bacterium]|nr:caspase family protein [Alphaproteobacteria bacterium]
MRLPLLAILASIALLLTPPAPARSETRVALVIGNGAYEHAPRLLNPAHDAAAVAAALKRSGFETVTATDLNQTGMENAVIDFARTARSADVALFYYSGHALQSGGANYLVPVDTNLRDQADLRRMARVDQIVADLSQAKNLRILILDSCRDNPFAEQLQRSIGNTRALTVSNGLAKIDTPQGMIMVYATQAGQTAIDGRGSNSPFTTAFLNHIEKREEIGVIFRDISEEVYATTQHGQLPELSLSLVGRYYLNGRPADTVDTSTHPTMQSAAATTAPKPDTELRASITPVVPLHKPAPAPRCDADRQPALASQGPAPKTAPTPQRHSEHPSAPAPLSPAQKSATASPEPDAGSSAVFRDTRLSAERGDPGARFELARMYLEGRETTPDYVLGMAWLIKAAAQGHVVAQNTVARLFEGGWSLPRDFQQSFDWQHKAAEQSLAWAQLKVGESSDLTRIVAPSDFAQALSWYSKAADPLDFVQAGLGQMYQNSQGSLQDHAQALAWYTRAADKLGSNAQQALRRIDSPLTREALEKLDPRHLTGG